MTRFAGKVALVTGGRSGIGQAIARRLAAEGARVFTAQRGGDAEFEAVPADFTDTANPAQVVADLVARAGRLDVLVNNAGVMQEALAEDMSLADWERTITVNLTAPFLLIKAAMPHLRAVGGSIVNIGSIEGLASNPKHAAYCASKAGLHGLTRAIAVGCTVALAMALWPGVSLAVAHPWAVLWFGLMGSLLLATLGLATSIWAEKFDHNAAITNFIIAPLSLLSGTFYVIENLDPAFQWVSRANPFFYVISGFRYGFLGESDIGSAGAVLGAGAGLLALNVVMAAAVYAVLRSGWKLKN